MNDRARDTAMTAHADRCAEVPGCETGPVGRAAFVAKELASIWREFRGHARPAPDPGTDEEDQ
ncbi:MAG TPA: hypothetical protein VF834_10200 [Streptosporangiaceae bacterium]